MENRVGFLKRETKETSISCELNLDGEGITEVDTGVGFFDHMISSLGKHARLDLRLACEGDIEIDDHHTVEDCAIVIGKCLDIALSSRVGINRFAFAYIPLDEALARAVIDLSGRPFPAINIGLKRESLGDLSCENVPHFFETLATSGRFALHVDVLKGVNDHHRSESAFKAVAIALRQAVSLDGTNILPSTKGVLS